MTYQSALVVLVPEAESLVGPFRIRYDSSAADGMPAHITLNHPFLPREEVASDAIESLKELFSWFPAFRYVLSSVQRFPGTLYLEPNPSRPLSDLIEAVVVQFPQSPPYGGAFKEVIPHLTVANADDEAEIERIRLQFGDACVGKLPIDCLAREVWLMDNRSGTWTKRLAFALADHL